MAVYIDDYNAPFRGMLMCHMIADTKAELLDMVKSIGVNPKWIQYEDTYKEHFDICLSKKKLAIKLGAIELTARQLAYITHSRQGSPFKPHPKDAPPPKPTLF